MPRTTATAIPSTSRAVNSPANIEVRRVVRYEHDGSVTVLADSHGGKRLNSPNDVVPHPDGSYWFTDSAVRRDAVRRGRRRAGRADQRERPAALSGGAGCGCRPGKAGTAHQLLPH